MEEKYQIMTEDELRKRNIACIWDNTCFISRRPLDGKTSRAITHPMIGKVFVHKDFVK